MGTVGLRQWLSLLALFGALTVAFFGLASWQAWRAKAAEEAEIARYRSARRVDIDELFAAYASNQVRADAEFGGRLLRVTGTVDAVFSGRPGENHVWIVSPEGRRVDCVVSEDVFHLSRGQTIPAIGKLTRVGFAADFSDCVVPPP